MHEDSTGPWYLKGFRKARQASVGWNVFKTLVHTTIFWSIFLYLIPWQMAALERMLGIPELQFAGKSVVAVVGFVSAGMLGLWSGLTMAIIGKGTPLPLDHPNTLVVKGPYRYVRNPMAIAGLTQGLFAGMFFGSWFALPYIIAGGVLWNYLARPPEEHHLELDFGAPYVHYKNHVSCWIPRFSPYVEPKR